MYGDAEIYLYPGELWDYIEENIEELRNVILTIAEDTTKDIEINIEIGSKADKDEISMTVYDGGKEIDREVLLNKYDATEACRYFYKLYFTDIVDVDEDQPEKDQEEEPDVTPPESWLEDRIDEREVILNDALTDFVDIVSDYEVLPDLGTVWDDMLDDILSIISDYGIPVYRPCYMDDGNGGEVFVEYPYESCCDDDAAE